MAAKTKHGNEWRADFEHVAALLTHLRMTWLLKHLPPRLVWSVYVGVNGFATIGLLGLLALAPRGFATYSGGPVVRSRDDFPSRRHLRLPRQVAPFFLTRMQTANSTVTAPRE